MKVCGDDNVGSIKSCNVDLIGALIFEIYFWFKIKCASVDHKWFCPFLLILYFCDCIRTINFFYQAEHFSSISISKIRLFSIHSCGNFVKCFIFSSQHMDDTQSWLSLYSQNFFHTCLVGWKEIFPFLSSSACIGNQFKFLKHIVMTDDCFIDITMILLEANILWQFLHLSHVFNSFLFFES